MLAFARLAGPLALRFGAAYLVPGVLVFVAVRLISRRWSNSPPLALALVACLGLTAAARTLTGGHWFAADEFAYEFGARLNEQGYLCLPAPPLAEFFACNNLFTTDGRWFPLYPPGWTGLLALSRFWIPPLVAVAVVLALYALAREWEGPEVARWVPWLALLCPGFVLNGGTLFSHLAATFWAVLALACFARAARRPDSLWPPLVSGLAAGMVLTTRTADGLLVGLGMVLYHLVRVVRKEVPLMRPAWLLCPLGVALSGSLTLIFNAQVGGSPYQTVGTVAVASAGFFSLERLWHALAAVARLLVWQAPGLAEGAMSGLRRLRSHDLLLMFLFGAFLATYSGWPGQVEVSSRYLLLPALLLLIPAARTLASRGVVLAALAVLMFAGAYPGFIHSMQAAYRDVEGDYVANYTPPNALIFRRTVLGPLAMASNRNDPWFRGRVSALFLEPERNQRLIRAMGNRPAFVLDFADGTYRLRHYEEPRPLDEDLLAAGANLATSVLDRERAEAAWLRVPVGSPYYASARYNAARSALTAGDLEKAAAHAREAGPAGGLLEGEALRRLGRPAEARAAYERAAAALPPGALRDQAAGWALRLR